MVSGEEADVEHWNKDWTFLARMHVQRGCKEMKEKQFTEVDPSKWMVSFPLSYVVDKCYKFGPLVTLGKCHEDLVVDKKAYILQYQVFCFPHGYNKQVMKAFLSKNYLFQCKIF